MRTAFYLFAVSMALQVVLSFAFPVHHTAETKKLFLQNGKELLPTEGWRGFTGFSYSVLMIADKYFWVVLYPSLINVNK